MTAAPTTGPAELPERFEPLETLGEGAFGVVFRCRDHARGGEIAVKLLRRGSPEALAAFKREFRVLADLVHPNLVCLHELLHEDGRWLLVQELLTGPSLEAATDGGRDEAALRRCFGGLASGLAALHAAGRLHRDLKPTNVRLAGDGRAVLLDFGLAVAHEQAGLERGFVGSPAHLAPEVAAGGAPTAAAELYALGTMLFTLRAGRPPFQGSAREQLIARRTRRAPPLAEVAPEATPALAALVDALLDPSPALRPDAATVAAALLGAPHDARPAGPSPLVGREAPLAAILAAVREAQAGRAGLVLLEGAAGAGKSTLLAAVREALPVDPARPALWLEARCFEHEQLPYKALDAAIDALVRALRDEPRPVALAEALSGLRPLFPVLDALGPLPAREAASEAPERLRAAAAAFRATLREVARARTPLLVLDDLQWGGLDALPLLSELLRPPDAPPVLVIAAFRAGAPAKIVEALRALGPSPLELSLAPLEIAEARALLHEVTGRAPSDELLASAGGNPFLLLELARAAATPELEGATSSSAEETLAAALEARLSRAGEGAREQLELLCLLGRPATGALLREASGAPSPGALVRLSAARLVRGDEANLEPYHDRVRELLVARLPPSTRTQRHGALARTLSRLGEPDPEELAHHLVGAGDPAAARPWLVRAAERAEARLAFHRAASLWERALQAPGEERTALQIRLGEARANAGLGAEAAEALLAAVPGVDASRGRELRRRAGSQLVRCGRVAAGLALLREVLQELGEGLPTTPRRALALLLGSRLRLALPGGAFRERPEEARDPRLLARIDALMESSIGLAAIDSIRAAALMARAHVLARGAGDPARLAVCLGFETAFSGNGGGPNEPRTRALAAEARALAERTGQPYPLATAEGGLGIGEFHLGHYETAGRLLVQGATRFEVRCVGAVKEAFTLRLFGIAALALRGELRALDAAVSEQRAAARARGDLYATANLLSGLPNLVHLAAGEPRAAREALGEARRLFGADGFGVPHFFDLVGRCHLALYEGDGAAALDALAHGTPALVRQLSRRTEWIALYERWLHGRALLAAPGAASQLGLVEQDARAIERLGRPWARPLGSLLRAGVEAVRRDEEAAELLFERAACEADEAGLLLHAAAARLRLAPLRGRDGAPERAALVALGATDPEAMARVVAP